MGVDLCRKGVEKALEEGSLRGGLKGGPSRATTDYINDLNESIYGELNVGCCVVTRLLRKRSSCFSRSSSRTLGVTPRVQETQQYHMD